MPGDSQCPYITPYGASLVAPYSEEMQFTEEELHRLQEIFKDAFGLEISEDEALDHATKLLIAGRILTDPSSYPDPTEGEPS